MQAPETEAGDGGGHLVIVNHQGKLMPPGVQESLVGKEPQRFIVGTHGLNARLGGLAIEPMSAVNRCGRRH